MSIVISSTTDSQDAVNAAAGITTAEVSEETKQSPPAEAARPVPEDEPDDPEDDGPEEETQEVPKPEQPPVPHKKGGYLRKIEALEREKGYASRRIEELEYALAARTNGKPAVEQPERQQPAASAKPTQDQFATYEEYDEARTDWIVTQKLQAREAQIAEEARQWQIKDAQEKARSAFQTRISEFRSTQPDFDERMMAVSDIRLSPAVEHALVGSEMGAAVAYELAVNPDELRRLNALAPMSAVMEIGRIEQRILSRSAPASPQKISPPRPPEPIRPVGQGSSGNVAKPLDEMDFQDYKRARERQIAAARRR